MLRHVSPIPRVFKSLITSKCENFPQVFDWYIDMIMFLLLQSIYLLSYIDRSIHVGTVLYPSVWEGNIGGFWNLRRDVYCLQKFAFPTGIRIRIHFANNSNAFLGIWLYLLFIILRGGDTHYITVVKIGMYTRLAANYRVTLWFHLRASPPRPAPPTPPPASVFVIFILFVLATCMSVCLVPLETTTKRALGPVEESLWIVVSLNDGPRILTQVVWKSSKCS